MYMEPVVDLSRPGHEPLEFKVAEINPQTVANAFRVSLLLNFGR